MWLSPSNMHPLGSQGHWLGICGGTELCTQPRKVHLRTCLPRTVPWMLLPVTEALNSAPLDRHFWTYLLHTTFVFYLCITFPPFFSSKSKSPYGDFVTVTVTTLWLLSTTFVTSREGWCLFVSHGFVGNDSICCFSFTPSSLLTQPHHSYSVIFPLLSARQINQ